MQHIHTRLLLLIQRVRLVTVTCTTCPSWLSYSSSTGKLTGTPDNDDVGANAVVLSATDQTTAVTQSFTVTVANVNSIGSVSLSGTTAEDQTLTATVSDPDGYDWCHSNLPMAEDGQHLQQVQVGLQFQVQHLPLTP